MRHPTQGRLAHQVGSLQRQFAQAPGLPFAVKIVDGTTVSMPDTPANQAAFPQPKTRSAASAGVQGQERGPGKAIAGHHALERQEALFFARQGCEDHGQRFGPQARAPSCGRSCVLINPLNAVMNSETDLHPCRKNALDTLDVLSYPVSRHSV